MSTKTGILPLHQVLFANFMNGPLAMIFLLQLMLLPEILLHRWFHAISASADVALLVGIGVTSVCRYTPPPFIFTTRPSENIYGKAVKRSWYSPP